MNRNILRISLPILRKLFSLVYSSSHPKGLKKEDAEFLKKLDLEGRTVYDVGAYKGYYSLFFARAVGSQGRVISFEPHPLNFQKLTKRIKRNLLENVEVRQIAIGKESGRRVLAFRMSGTGTASLQEGLKGNISLDKNLSTQPIVYRYLLLRWLQCGSLPSLAGLLIPKDLEVLSGMKGTLKQYKPELLIEIHGAERESKLKNAGKIVDFLIDQRYSLRHVESNLEITANNFEIAREGHLYCF